MILVTEPGKVGASAARTLAAQGHPVLVIARRPEQRSALAAAGVEVIAGDLGQPETITEAVSDVRSIILVTPARSRVRDRRHRRSRRRRRRSRHQDHQRLRA